MAIPCVAAAVAAVALPSSLRHGSTGQADLPVVFMQSSHRPAFLHAVTRRLARQSHIVVGRNGDIMSEWSCRGGMPTIGGCPRGWLLNAPDGRLLGSGVIDENLSQAAVVPLTGAWGDAEFAVVDAYSKEAVTIAGDGAVHNLRVGGATTANHPVMIAQGRTASHLSAKLPTWLDRRDWPVLLDPARHVAAPLRIPGHYRHVDVLGQPGPCAWGMAVRHDHERLMWLDGGGAHPLPGARSPATTGEAGNDGHCHLALVLGPQRKNVEQGLLTSRDGVHITTLTPADLPFDQVYSLAAMPDRRLVVGAGDSSLWESRGRSWTSFRRVGRLPEPATRTRLLSTAAGLFAIGNHVYRWDRDRTWTRLVWDLRGRDPGDSQSPDD